MNKNILSFISICKKASKLETGADVCFDALELSNARLILLSSDCSDNSAKRIISKACDKNVPIIKLEFTKFEIGAAVSKSECAILAITDIGLAASLGKKLAQNSDDLREVSEKLDLKLKRKIERENNKNIPELKREKKEQQNFVYEEKINKKPYSKFSNNRKPSEYTPRDNKFVDKKPYKKFENDRKPSEYTPRDNKFGEKKPYKKFENDRKPSEFKPKKYGDKKPYSKFSKDRKNNKNDIENPPKTAVKWSDFRKKV